MVDIYAQLDVEDLMEKFENSPRDMSDLGPNGETQLGFSLEKIRAIVEQYANEQIEAAKDLKWKEIPGARECGDYLESDYECPHCHQWQEDWTEYCPSCGKYVGLNVEYAKRTRK